MTLKKFMWMDILILSIWGILMDVIAYVITGWIATSSLKLPITESVFIAPSFTIIYLIYQRWKDKGFLVNGVFLMLHLILYSAQIFRGYEFVLMMISSYMVFGLTIFTIKYVPHIKLSQWFYHLMSFVGIYVLMILVEYAVGTILSVNISLLGVIIRHLINILICSLVIVIMSVQSNLVVDMKTHLIQSKKEEE